VPKTDEMFGRWSSRISDGEEMLKDRVALWDKYLSYYRMDLPEHEVPEGDNVFTNHLFGLSRIILPSVYFKNPEITVVPRGRTPSEYAKIHEALLQYEIEEIGMEREIRNTVMDCLFCGLGVIKLGYAPKLDNLRHKVRDPFEVDAEDLLSLYREETGEVSQDVLNTLPFVLRVDPRFLLLDPLATSLSDSRYVIHTIPKVVEDLKKDSRYSRELTSGIQATHSLHTLLSGEGLSYDYSGSDRFINPDDELVLLYEIWDKENQEYLVIDSHTYLEGSPRFLVKKPWPYDLDDFPFELLDFNPDPSSPYGVPDAMTWYSLARAMNFIDSMHYNHIKRFQRKYAVKKGVLDEGRYDDLTTARDGAIFEIAGDPGKDILPLRDAPISTDIYNLRSILKDSVSFISGVTEQRRGESEQRARTATEASILEQQARIRDNDRLYRVSMFTQNILRKLNILNREFLDAEDVAVFTADPEVLDMWQTQSREILNAEVDVTIHVGSSGFKSREVQVKQYLDFLNIVSGVQETDPNTGVPVNMVDLRALTMRIAEAMGIPDYKALFAERSVPPMDPDTMAAMSGGGGGGMNPLNNGTPSLGSQLSRVQHGNLAPNPTMGD